MSFNLLTTPWLPVSHADGSQSIISPADLTPGDPANPALMPAWPRPDLNIAALEFLIGLFTIAFAPEEEEWGAQYINPPSKTELEAAFAPLTDAFVLDGPGPRFMQDKADLGEATIPIEALFIDSAGENTIKKNADLMVKRDHYQCLSRGAAAIALYALQQFAPAGGAGHRTSMRGGGPLTTLTLPRRTDGAPSTLWQIVWSNVICSDDGIPRKEDLSRIFPWLAPTLTSEKGTSELHQKDPKAHMLQAYFGMPRRIKVQFEENTARRPCDLTGQIDDVITTAYATKAYGVNYGHWQHPLTPYQEVSENELSPRKAKPNSLTYPNWAAISLKTSSGKGGQKNNHIARTVNQFRRLRRNIPRTPDNQALPKDKLLVAGWAMSNMTPLDYILSEEPLHLHPNGEAQQELDNFADRLVEAGDTACRFLIGAVQAALKSGGNKPGSETTLIETIRSSFFSATNTPFHEGLGNALNIDPTEMAAREPIAARWREVLEAAALSLFDSYVNQDFRDPERARPVVKARSSLKRNLKSKKFKTALGLTEPKRKEGAAA